MLSLLITLLVICVVIWLAFWVIGQMGLPEPVGLVARVIVGIIALVLLLERTGVLAGGLHLG